MIEMRKQLSMMKRRVSEMDQLGATVNSERNDDEETPSDPVPVTEAVQVWVSVHVFLDPVPVPEAVVSVHVSLDPDPVPEAVQVCVCE